MRGCARAHPLAARLGEGVLLGQQLRALCLETELGKKKKEKVRLSVSVPLVEGGGGDTVNKRGGGV